MWARRVPIQGTRAFSSRMQSPACFGLPFPPSSSPLQQAAQLRGERSSESSERALSVGTDLLDS